VRAKYHSIPDHDVVLRGSAADTRGRIFLQLFKVSHETTSGRSGHRGEEEEEATEEEEEEGWMWKRPSMAYHGIRV